jgi:hypothetical protein
MADHIHDPAGEVRVSQPRLKGFAERLEEDVVKGSDNVQEDTESEAIAKYGFLKFVNEDVQSAFGGATRPKSMLIVTEWHIF